jgi:hypothetical protein
MAEIVLGIGMSHGPSLTLAPDQWDLRAEFDRAFKSHPYRGQTYSFDQLLEMRAGENLAAQHRPEVRAERFQRCQVALDRIGSLIRAARPDVLVVIGDDQEEWFHSDIRPPFAVFHGDSVLNSAFDPKEAAGLAPGIEIAERARRAPQDQYYPVVSELGRRILDEAMEQEFDVTACGEIPSDAKGPRTIGHAVSFVYRRVLKDDPIPLVPIFINAFYPPSQPRPKRCYDFGRRIGAAIRSWGKDKRVVVLGSGGMSHFVIDEELDQRMLSAMQRRDAASLTAEPDGMFRSGSSEIKNWIVAAGALAETDLAMQVLDYVPCYRSDAGTGTANCFAVWQ